MSKISEIMIVDDDEISNFITQRCLENSGTVDKIIVHYESKGALKELLLKKKEAQSLPEYILLDINMPIMDGFDFLEECKSNTIYQDIKVIMYTSSLRQEDRKKALAYSSVKGYLEKPLKMASLLSIFESTESKN